MSRTKRGFLVLADVSGFTAFVTATELEHGPPMIADLLEKVIERIAPPLAVVEIEGDAVFALAADGAVEPAAGLLDVLRQGFVAFRARQRELAADDSCSCNACRSVGRLRLKMVGHHGAFLEQRVSGRAQLAGRDVILVHLLLKNGLGREGDYTLLTRAALETMGVDPTQTGLASHTERYDHFGDVDCFVHDVAPDAPARVSGLPPARAAGASLEPGVGVS